MTCSKCNQPLSSLMLFTSTEMICRNDDCGKIVERVIGNVNRWKSISEMKTDIAGCYPSVVYFKWDNGPVFRLVIHDLESWGHHVDKDSVSTNGHTFLGYNSSDKP